MKKKNILYAKLQENFSDLADFVKRSGLPLTFETARRAIYEDKAVSIPSLIILTKYLGFTPSEINKILIEAGDKDFSALIGTGEGSDLTEQEKALVEAYRQIKSRDTVADQLDLIARADGVDISAQVTKLRNKKRSG